MHRKSAPRRGERQPFGLTAREVEVLQALPEHRSTREMALHLGLSPLTIDAYVRSIRRKMGVRSRVEAVAVGIAAGVVRVDAPYRRSSDSA